MKLALKLVPLIHQHDGRFDWSLAELETHDDDLLTSPHTQRSSPVYPDHTRSGVIRDDVGLKPLVAVIAHHQHAFTSPDTNPIHQGAIDRNAADAVRIGFGDQAF